MKKFYTALVALMMLPSLSNAAANMAFNKTGRSAALTTTEERLIVSDRVINPNEPSKGTDINSGSYTVATWVKLDQYANINQLDNNQVVMSYTPSHHLNTNGVWSVIVDTNGNLRVLGYGRYISSSITTTQVPLDQWNYLTFVYNDDATTYSLYLNGELAGEWNAAEKFNWLDENPVFNFAGWQFGGSMDEVQIYNKALTAEEVAEAKKSASSVEGLAALYTFDELAEGSTTRFANQVEGADYEMICQTITAKSSTGSYIWANGIPYVESSSESSSTYATVAETEPTLVEGRALSSTLTVPAQVEGGQFTVTINGEIAEEGAHTVAPSDEIIVTATPAAGYYLATLLCGEKEITSGEAFFNETDAEIKVVFANTLHTLTIEAPANGTLTVTANGTALESGAEVAEGTILTLSAEANTGYQFASFLVNGEPYAESTVTMEADLTIGATFEERLEASYTAPTGEAGDTNCYLETVTVSGAAKDVVISRTQKNGNVYEACDADDEIFEVYPGSEFSMNFLAKYTNTTTTSAPNPQDLRYCVAFVYADWNADGEFELLGRYGYGAGESNFAGNVKANYDEVMNITHNFSVPEDAQLGRTRIRVIYTEAWDANVSGGGNIPSGNYNAINKGYSYDFCLNVIEPAYETYELYVFGEKGPVSVYSDSELTNCVASDNDSVEGEVFELSSRDCKDGLYVVVNPSEQLKLVHLYINMAECIDDVVDNVYHIENVTELQYFDLFGIMINPVYEPVLSGIEEIAIDLNAADVEYFNLQGIRVAAEDLTSGLYIARQGEKTMKVVIKK